MATVMIFEERGSHWSQQVPAVRQVNGRRMSRPFLSAKGVACEANQRSVEMHASKAIYVVSVTEAAPQCSVHSHEVALASLVQMGKPGVQPSDLAVSN